MEGQTTIQVTLVVKGDPIAALEGVYQRLIGPITSWFVEDVGVKPPYQEGSLLWYQIADPETFRVEERQSLSDKLLS